MGGRCPFNDAEDDSVNLVVHILVADHVADPWEMEEGGPDSLVGTVERDAGLVEFEVDHGGIGVGNPKPTSGRGGVKRAAMRLGRTNRGAAEAAERTRRKKRRRAVRPLALRGKRGPL